MEQCGKTQIRKRGRWELARETGVGSDSMCAIAPSNAALGAVQEAIASPHALLNQRQAVSAAQKSKFFS
jgi:hypothetical protein